MSLPSNAIGIFDSGVGGLTVMQQIMHLLPHERLIYFGDTARVPYGNKSSQTIVRYSIENTICLLEKNIKLLVVACNTASAFALSKLRQLFNLPIVGVIEAGAEKAVEVTRNQCIAVLGTKGTIQSGAYQAAIHKLAPQATILPIACPLFVPLVEEQWLQHPATHLIVQEYLHPIRKQEVDTVLLGCTHYPLLGSLIQQEVGEKVSLVDSASTCAHQVAHLLKQRQLLSPILQGQHQYYVSDDPEKFHSLAERLFGHALQRVELLSPEHLHRTDLF
jgi:glutamate racemase